MRLDVLADLYNSVIGAIENGESFDTRRGWVSWHKRERFAKADAKRIDKAIG
jgi:dsRNA-specific ribonuclease